MKKKQTEKFWMVWSPQGSRPTRRHYTRESADTEASRLANANPGTEFFTLKAVQGVVADKPRLRLIKFNKYDPTSEIPF